MIPLQLDFEPHVVIFILGWGSFVSDMDFEKKNRWLIASS